MDLGIMFEMYIQKTEYGNEHYWSQYSKPTKWQWYKYNKYICMVQNKVGDLNFL